MHRNHRAFGDFETDLKRSDSGSIPDRKVCFLAFICSLNTFQSKNPPYSLSSLHFQPDEKRGKRAQNYKRRLLNPVLRYKYERREDFENFGSSYFQDEVVSENSMHGRNTGTLGELEVSTRAPRTRYASKSSRCRLCQLPSGKI